MKKPKCKICGAHHWANEPHQFPEDWTVEDIKAGSVSPEKPKAVEPEVQKEALEDAKAKNRPLDPRDYCPTCGRPMRALTPAERQARFRRRRAKP